MTFGVKSKVGLEHVAARVWGFSERTDVDEACDWPAARLAEGQLGCVSSEMTVLQMAWSGRLRSLGGGSILEAPGRLVLIEDYVAISTLIGERQQR